MIPLNYVFTIRYEYRRIPISRLLSSYEIELSEAEQRKKHLYRHWIRPRFLQYNYIYNYRKNYYDDVIDYLDKRNKGYFIDTPRAQTWAERALRTYTHEIDRLRPIFIPSYHVNIHRADESALRKTYVNTFHAEHSHNFYHRKYKSVLY
ncbi:uncharacterized protein LOC142329348 isoform X2 [Lycorma delicatula]|uniref:uncharacterized protein LOC142329348 isoform X2 n=1 Tax=Lycorma delicatula TaxID=130591 RepID=UPI003F519F14